MTVFPSPQATTLLTMDKYSHADVPNINSTCFKLNSLQLQALLQNYHCAPDEPLIPTVSLLCHLLCCFNIPEPLAFCRYTCHGGAESPGLHKLSVSFLLFRLNRNLYAFNRMSKL